MDYKKKYLKYKLKYLNAKKTLKGGTLDMLFGRSNDKELAGNEVKQKNKILRLCGVPEKWLENIKIDELEAQRNDLELEKKYETQEDNKVRLTADIKMLNEKINTLKKIIIVEYDKYIKDKLNKKKEDCKRSFFSWNFCSSIPTTYKEITTPARGEKYSIPAKAEEYSIEDCIPMTDDIEELADELGLKNKYKNWKALANIYKDKREEVILSDKPSSQWEKYGVLYKDALKEFKKNLKDEHDIKNAELELKNEILEEKRRGYIKYGLQLKEPGESDRTEKGAEKLTPVTPV